MLTKVVSGGQTGVERDGLVAALEVGFTVEVGAQKDIWQKAAERKGLQIIRIGSANMNRLLILLCLVATVSGCAAKDWRTASRESAGIAPDPAVTKEAVVQAY